jgi:stabilization protein
VAGGAPLNFLSGAYTAKSVNSNAQAAENVYLEQNPPETNPPTPFSIYQRPGKTLVGSPALSNAGAAGAGRGLYTASDGQLYAVIGSTVYAINQAWQFNTLGNIAAGTNPTSMADNGKTAGGDVVLVDGTTTGYTIDMSSFAFAPIVDGTGLFTGADSASYLQTFFLFNTIPNTQSFIISNSDSVTFNPLNIAAKSSYPDNIEFIGIRQREVWLMGSVAATEPWYLSGAADFPFEAIPSVYVNYGVAGKYCTTFADDSLFWVSRNTQGKGIIVKSEGYAAKRISTHAIENEIQGYPTITDAVASVYQIEGHTFVVWTFPSGDTTWVYDLATKQWHKSTWTDANGVPHRDRALFYQQAYGSTVALDWENGNLYLIDPTVYQDNGTPIVFRRGFPHVLKSLERISHWNLTVNMECGTIQDPNAETPMLSMRYSDDAGHTWSIPMMTSLGNQGEYLTTPQFNQLGMTRDRVYELFWSENMKTALLAAYLDAEEADS